MSYARAAAIMCSNHRLWDYMNHLELKHGGEAIIRSTQDAADWMRAHFEITSRKQLEEPENGAAWLEFIENFNRWLNSKNRSEVSA